MLRITRLIAIAGIVLVVAALSANSVAHTAQTTASADLSTTYSIYNSTPAYAGQQYTFVVTYHYDTTTDASPAENVVYSITLPEDTLLVSVNGEGEANGTHYSTFPENIGPIISGNQLSWILGTLYEHNAGWFEVTVLVPADAFTGPPFTVQAVITSTTPDPNPNNNTLQHQQTVEQATLDLVAYDEQVSEDAGPGSVIEYMTLIQPMSEYLPTKGLIITQSLSSDLSFLDWSGCTNRDEGTKICEDAHHRTITPTISGQTIEWRLPDIQYPEVIRMYSTARVNPTQGTGDSVTSTIAASNLLHDPDLNNSSAYTTTQLITPETDASFYHYLSSKLSSDGTYQYSLSGSNYGTLPLTNTVLSTTLPEGFTYVLSSGWRTYDHSGLYGKTVYDTMLSAETPTVDGRQVTWSLPTLWAGDSFKVFVVSTPDPDLQTGDSITVNSLLSATNYNTTYESSENIEIPDPTTTVEQYADVWIEATRSQDQVSPGGETLYTLRVENADCDPYSGCDSNAAAINVIVTDTLPAGITFKNGYSNDAPSPLIEPYITPLTPTVNGQVIIWEIPYIQIGSFRYLHVIATGSEGLNIGDTLDHHFEITHDRESNPLDNQSQNTFVVAEAEVNTYTQLRFDDDYAGYPGPGGMYRLDIDVGNDGHIPAENMIITNTLPAHVSFTGWDAQLRYMGDVSDVTDLLSVQVLGNEIIWNASDLIPHGALQLYSYGVVDAGVLPGSSLNFTVASSTTSSDVSSTNNVDSTTLTISPHEADLSIAPYARTYTQSGTTSTIASQATPSVRYVPTGSNLTYAITIDNPANSVMRDVVVTATVPEGTTYVSAECEGLDTAIQPTLDGNTLTWDLGTIPALNTITLYPTIHIPASMESGIELTSNVTLETVDPDWYYHNNYATTTVTTFHADSWLYLPVVSK